MGRVTNFFGCRILRGDELIHENLWVRDGVIVDPVDVDYIADVSIDCREAIIAPSFIDLKLNGALEVSFNKPEDVTIDNLRKVQAYLPNTGVTLFCPTITTTSTENYRKLLPAISRCTPTPEVGAGIFGIHLDGPFISQLGAHTPEYVKKFANGADSVSEVYGDNLENVAIVTLAPELPRALEVIRHLRRKGVFVSLGHSKASICEAIAAVEHGATMISHLFNAMPSFHHRDPGIVGLVASNEGAKLHYTIISDGYHLHDAALRMAYRMAPRELVLISDAVSPLGVGPGKYAFGEQEIEVEETDGRSKCTKAGTDILFGSVCPLHRAVRNLVNVTRCSVAYALSRASAAPAKMLGLYPRKGCLDFGCDADFVILERGTLDLYGTFIAGKKVADTGLLPDLQKFSLAIKQVPAFYAPRTQKWLRLED